MTMAESIPDAIAFARSLGDAFLVIAIIGCVFTLALSACVLSFPTDDPIEPSAQPPVTVLKPLHDAEPGLRGRLAAFCRQDYAGTGSGPMRHARPQLARRRRGRCHG